MIQRIQVSNNFYLDEFIDPVTYFTDADHGLSKIDPSLIDLVQLLRDLYGSSININGWWKHLPQVNDMFDAFEFLNFCIAKKIPVWSGFRSDKCTIGAKGSAHRLGQAQDPKGDEKEFFKIICENAQEFYDAGLRRVENVEFTNGWCHMDTSPKNHHPGKIRIINPATGNPNTSNKHAGDIEVKTGAVIMFNL